MQTDPWSILGGENTAGYRISLKVDEKYLGALSNGR